MIETRELGLFGKEVKPCPNRMELISNRPFCEGEDYV
jgi:hypothetical protein